MPPPVPPLVRWLWFLVFFLAGSALTLLALLLLR